MKMAKLQMKWLFRADNSKENVEIAAKSDINRSNVKIGEIKMAVVTVEMRVEIFIALIVASLGMRNKTASNSKGKTHD
jgi:hypothetical protein